MEGSIRRHRRACLLLHWTQLLAVDFRLCYRGMDLLLRHQRRYTSAHPERRVRRQRMGHCHPTAVLQDCINLHISGCDMVRDKIQRHE